MNAIEIAQKIAALEATDNIDADVKHDTMDSLHASLEDKLDGLRFHMEDVQRDLATLEFDEARLQAIKATVKKKKADLDWCSQYLTNTLQVAGKEKVRTDHHIYEVKHKSYSVDIYDEAKVPDEFKKVKTTYSVDKKAVKEAIDGGQPVPGAKINHNFKTVID